MTSLPPTPPRKLGLVIDLDICVGCHACAVACKQWNDIGAHGPLNDIDAYGAQPDGAWLNRVHSYDACTPAGDELTVHFPRSCLHCDNAACVTVCPTGASFKRAEDGIVLVDADICIGCNLCAWACPYGAREIDPVEHTMRKCTLCVDRIDNPALPEAERQPACVSACPTRARHFGDLADPDSAVSKLVRERDGQDLMPELGYQPTNKYLPPRRRRNKAGDTGAGAQLDGHGFDPAAATPLQRWADRLLSR
ncbi:MAG: 4Fe-4S dicluster domain-containing protein [Xanthomonadales bacterium]|nr:4Fe-4S dicluster domain-containing protein [Xanthomonadales bacterium]